MCIGNRLSNVLSVRARLGPGQSSMPMAFSSRFVKKAFLKFLRLPHQQNSDFDNSTETDNLAFFCDNLNWSMWKIVRLTGRIRLISRMFSYEYVKLPTIFSQIMAEFLDDSDEREFSEETGLNTLTLRPEILLLCSVLFLAVFDEITQKTIGKLFITGIYSPDSKSEMVDLVKRCAQSLID